jgi:uncharacterized protein (DUF2236 family)
MLSDAPLGPDSLTWRLFGDRRMTLLIVRAGVLQNMHPAVGAGVSQHSDFFANPWNRLLRSIPPILGVIYDGPDARRTGAWVRDQHKAIKGVDQNGRRYHALSPDVYYWTHATFFESQIAMTELFGDPLSDDEKEQLYRESIRWYAMYGLSMRPVPPDYAAFRAYWQHMLEEVLEETEPVRWTFDPRRGPVPAPYRRLRPVWPLLRPLLMDGSVWVAKGTLPPEARAKLGLRWTAGDQRRLDALAATVRRLWPLLPEPVRIDPRARAAYAREGAALDRGLTPAPA